MPRIDIGRTVSIEEALNWRLASQSLREALVDNVRHNIDVPDEFLDVWESHVEVQGDEFVVSIYAEA